MFMCTVCFHKIHNIYNVCGPVYLSVSYSVGSARSRCVLFDIWGFFFIFASKLSITYIQKRVHILWYSKMDLQAYLYTFIRMYVRFDYYSYNI